MYRLNQIIKKVIKEATSQRGGAAGQYVTPVQPGFRPFNEDQLTPFTQSVSNYKNPLVQYDSLDHKTPKNNSQMRPFTEKVKFNEWVNLSFDNLINEADTTITAGMYNAPLEIGAYKWKKELNPFTDSVETYRLP